jgi:hypothetical protein
LTDHPLCPRCHGSGEVRWLAAPPDPQTEETARCSTCAGQGTTTHADLLWSEHVADLMSERRITGAWVRGL